MSRRAWYTTMFAALAVLAIGLAAAVGVANQPEQWSPPGADWSVPAEWHDAVAGYHQRHPEWFDAPVDWREQWNSVRYTCQFTRDRFADWVDIASAGTDGRHMFVLGITYACPDRLEEIPWA